MASENLQHNSSTNSIENDSVITESRARLYVELLAEEIEDLATTGDIAVLTTALMAAELKQRIVAGEAGEGVKWAEWMVKHTHMSKSHLYALVEIGSASNPAQALERWRRRNRERSKNRINAKYLSENHINMLKLVRKLTDDEAKAEYLRLWKRYPGYV